MNEPPYHVEGLTQELHRPMSTCMACGNEFEVTSFGSNTKCQKCRRANTRQREISKTINKMRLK